MESPRLLRITTVPISLHLLLRGQFRYFVEAGYTVDTVSAGGPEVKEVLKEGVRHTVVPFTRQITPVKDLVCLVKLVKLIRKTRPNIVHTHTPKAGLLGMIAAWLCRVPVRMHTVAGLPLMEAQGLKRRLLLLTERITYYCSTHIYPNSEGLKQYIEKNIASLNGKMKLIGKGSSNGIDSQYFRRSDEVTQAAQALRKQYEIGTQEIVFCFVGRIVRDKGINELLEAFERIVREIPCRLILVGPFEDSLDPISARSREIIHSLGKKIILAGYQPDVRPALAASDVFVFPSYREGFPNVVLQACCLEVACIVSDINGCNEIIRQGSTGIIVKPKDAEALYHAMHHLATRHDQRQGFAKASRAFVVAGFEQRYIWGELKKEYEGVLPP